MTTTKNNEHKKLNFSSEREQSQACLNSAEHEKNQGRKVLNVPNLRFPEFQGKWEYFLINDVCSEFKSGKNIKADSVFECGEYPVYGGNGLRGYTSSYNHEGSYVLIGRQGALCGNVRSVYGKTYITEHAIAVAGNEKSNTNFLHYLFLKMNLGQYSDQSAQPGLAVNKLLKLKVALPIISEQTKIAKLLSLLDERIATQNKIIEDLKMLKSAIIEKVFNGKHSEKLQLNDVGSYIRGLTYSSNDVVEHGGTLVMRSNNIINGSLLDYNNNVVFVNKQMSAEQQLQDGDVVICMANGSSSLVGKSSFYDGSCHSPITVGAFCGIYRSKESIVKWLFQTNKYRRYIWNSLQGGNGAIANLNGEDILNMSFSIPNATIKDTCVKMLTSVDSALENNMSLCALYTLQKQHLLRQMFI